MLIYVNKGAPGCLQSGYAYAFRFYAVAPTPVRFQVWRPVVGSSEEVELVGQYRFIPSFLNIMYEVSRPLPLDRHICHGPLTRYVNWGLRMRREWRERFPRHRLQRKPLVSDPGMHHGTCVTHVA